MIKYLEFPNEAFDYLQEQGLVKKIIRYAINHKNIRNTIYLKPWLEAQVAEAFQDEKFISLVKKVVGNETHYDNIVIKVLRYCMNRSGFLTYKTDNEIWDSNEYWQTFEETWSLRTGDCEDGAILMYVMNRVAGVPANRMLLFAGSVEGGGHCWLGYRPTYDPINFRFLDWCYWGSLASVETRNSFAIVGQDIYPVQGTEKRYYRIWWAFNEDNTYAGFKKTWR